MSKMSDIIGKGMTDVSDKPWAKPNWDKLGVGDNSPAPTPNSGGVFFDKNGNSYDWQNFKGGLELVGGGVAGWAGQNLKAMDNPLAQSLGNTLSNEGEYLTNQAMNAMQNYGEDPKFAEMGVLDRVADWDYMNPLNPRGWRATVANAMGTSVPSMLAMAIPVPGASAATKVATTAATKAAQKFIASQLAKKIAQNSAYKAMANGAGKIANTKAGQFIADRAKDKITLDEIGKAAKYAGVAANSESVTEGYNNLAAFSQQADEKGLTGLDKEKYIAERMNSQAMDNMPGLLAAEFLPGLVMTGNLSRALGQGNASRLRRGAYNAGAVLGGNVGEQLTEVNQEQIAKEYRNEPHGNWYNPLSWTPDESGAGAAGFFGGGMAIPGAVYDTLKSPQPTANNPAPQQNSDPNTPQTPNNPVNPAVPNTPTVDNQQDNNIPTQDNNAPTQDNTNNNTYSDWQVPNQREFDWDRNMQNDTLSDLTEAKLRLLDNLYYKKFGHHLYVTSMSRNGGGGSWHDSGQAFDVVTDELETNAEARRWIEQKARELGLKPLDEYENPSAQATGGHMHFSDHGADITGYNGQQDKENNAGSYYINDPDPNFTDIENEAWGEANWVSQELKDKYGYNVPAEFIYRQWAQESTYDGKRFNSQLARENNNFGGLTQVEPNGEENKQRDGGNYYRMFNNMHEYAEAYAHDFLKRYPELKNVNSVEEFAGILKKHGYFGDSLENYVAGMNGVDKIPHGGGIRRNNGNNQSAPNPNIEWGNDQSIYDEIMNYQTDLSEYDKILDSLIKNNEETAKNGDYTNAIDNASKQDVLSAADKLMEAAANNQQESIYNKVNSLASNADVEGLKDFYKKMASINQPQQTNNAPKGEIKNNTHADYTFPTTDTHTSLSDFLANWNTQKQQNAQGNQNVPQDNQPVDNAPVEPAIQNETTEPTPAMDNQQESEQENPNAFYAQDENDVKDVEALTDMANFANSTPEVLENQDLIDMWNNGIQAVNSGEMPISELRQNIENALAQYGYKPNTTKPVDNVDSNVDNNTPQENATDNQDDELRDPRTPEEIAVDIKVNTAIILADACQKNNISIDNQKLITTSIEAQRTQNTKKLDAFINYMKKALAKKGVDVEALLKENEPYIIPPADFADVGKNTDAEEKPAPQQDNTADNQNVSQEENTPAEETVTDNAEKKQLNISDEDNAAFEAMNDFVSREGMPDEAGESFNRVMEMLEDGSVTPSEARSMLEDGLAEFGYNQTGNEIQQEETPSENQKEEPQLTPAQQELENLREEGKYFLETAKELELPLDFGKIEKTLSGNNRNNVKGAVNTLKKYIQNNLDKTEFYNSLDDIEKSFMDDLTLFNDFGIAFNDVVEDLQKDNDKIVNHIVRQMRESMAQKGSEYGMNPYMANELTQNGYTYQEAGNMAYERNYSNNEEWFLNLPTDIKNACKYLVEHGQRQEKEIPAGTNPQTVKAIERNNKKVNEYFADMAKSWLRDGGYNDKRSNQWYVVPEMSDAYFETEDAINGLETIRDKAEKYEGFRIPEKDKNNGKQGTETVQEAKAENRWGAKVYGKELGKQLSEKAKKEQFDEEQADWNLHEAQQREKAKQEDSNTPARKGSRDKNPIDNAVDMLHNNFNRYVEVSDMVFTKYIPFPTKEILDNKIGINKAPFGNADESKLVKSLYSFYNQSTDNTSKLSTLSAMIVYARRGIDELREKGHEPVVGDSSTRRYGGRTNGGLYGALPRSIRGNSEEIRRAIRSSINPSAIENFLKLVDDMDTFDNESVFSFANKLVNGKPKYYVSLKDNHSSKVDDYRKEKLDSIVKKYNGKSVGNLVTYVFDDINDRNDFLNKATDYISNGEKASLREKDIYNKKSSKALTKELDELPKIPRNKQTITEKLLSDFSDKFGIKLNIVDNKAGKGNRGLFIADGQIYLNRSGNVPARQVFWHEFTHWVKENNPAAYSAMENVVKDSITPERIRKYRDSVAGGQYLSDSDVIEEMIADGVAKSDMRKQLMQAVIDSNPSRAKRILGNLWNMCYNLKDSFMKAIGKEGTRNLPQGLNATEMKNLEGEIKRAMGMLTDKNGKPVFNNKNINDYVRKESATNNNIKHSSDRKHSAGPSNNNPSNPPSFIEQKFKTLSNWFNGTNQSGTNDNLVDKKKLKELLEVLTGYKIKWGHMKGAKDDVIFNTMGRIARCRRTNDFKMLINGLSTVIYTSVGVKEQDITQNMRDYMVSYIMDNGNVSNVSPEAKQLEQLMTNNPDFAAKLNDVTNAFDTWSNMSLEEQHRKMMGDYDGKTVSRFLNGNYMYDQLVEELGPLERLVKEVEKGMGTKLDVGANPLIAFRLFRGHYGKAITMTEGKGKAAVEGLKAVFPRITDSFDNFKTLSDIIGSLGIEGDQRKLKDFGAYCLAKHHLDLHERNKKNQAAGKKVYRFPPEYSEENCKKTIAKYDNERPEYKKAQQDIVNYSKVLVDILHDSGVLSDKRADQLRNTFPNYVPMHRDLGKDFGNSQLDLEGSEADIINPIDALIHNTYEFIKVAEKNKAKQKLAIMARINGLGELIEEVQNPNKDYTIPYMVDGKKHYLEVGDSQLAKAINNMGNDSVDIYTGAFAAIAGLSRAMFTSINPAFSVANMMRDTQDSALYSKHGFKNFKEQLKYMRRAFEHIDARHLGKNKSAMYYEFKASGADQASAISNDRNYAQQTRNKIVRSWTKCSPKEFAIKLLESTQALAEASEAINRIAVYEKNKDAAAELARVSGETADMASIMAEAAFEARDTMDFARGGKGSRTWNKFTPFANAAIQGTDKMLRASGAYDVKDVVVEGINSGDWKKFKKDFVEEMQKNPKKFGGRLVWRAAVPALAISLLSSILGGGDDDDWWDDLPAWQKETYWCTKVGDYIVRIPKGQDLATKLTSYVIQDAYNIALGHSEFKGRPYYHNIPVAATPGIAPHVFKILGELWTGYSVFYDRDIVPKSEQRLPGYKQAGPKTSKISQAISKMIYDQRGESPSARKIDYFVQSLLGAPGRFMLLDIPDTIGNTVSNGPTDTIAKYDADWPNLPILGRYFTTPNRSAESVNEFYEAWNDQQKYYNDYKESKEKNKWLDMKKYNTYKDANAKISKLNKKEREILNNETYDAAKRRELLEGVQKRRKEIARKALGK